MRSPTDILATGAAWITETELAALVVRIAGLEADLELSRGETGSLDLHRVKLLERVAELEAEVEDFRRRELRAQEQKVQALAEVEEWRDLARTEMAGRREAQAEVERLKASAKDAIDNGEVLIETLTQERDKAEAKLAEAEKLISAQERLITDWQTRHAEIDGKLARVVEALDALAAVKEKP